MGEGLNGPVCLRALPRRRVPERGQTMPNDIEYMQRAIALAEQGRGQTSPNPMVGCVVVRDGEVIGEGFHEGVGLPHAEVKALEAIKESGGDARGATIYVTLEPCNHTGHTPPCADRLIEEGVGRVVAAMADPNPQVAGQGALRLRQAGIEVDLGVCEAEARLLNEAWLKFITTSMPFVISKVGMSLDGKIATHTGDSRWVTGETARAVVHRLRNEVDAIMVGSRTVMLDDPSLTTRLEEGWIKDPVRIILDSDEYLDATRRVFHIESTAPTWVVSPVERDIEGADDVIIVPRSETGVDMTALMKVLGQRQITSVLIEGGGTTHASAFEAGIVDKCLFFVAPKIIGGKEAVSAVEGIGAARMADVVRLEGMHATPIGEDILIEAYVARNS